jgi:hypothetical protein
MGGSAQAGDEHPGGAGLARPLHPVPEQGTDQTLSLVALVCSDGLERLTGGVRDGSPSIGTHHWNVSTRR